jgi:MYXO-CTERM domain-containing protein
MPTKIQAMSQKIIQACVVLWLILVCANSYADGIRVNLIQTGAVQADTVQADVVAQPTIANGTPATPTQVPWQAALYAENNAGDIALICSATLINAKWLLTAAHCMDLKALNGSLIAAHYVVVGTADLDASNTAQVYRVSNRIVHPDYDDSRNLDNDIALLELSEPVDLASCGSYCRVIPWLPNQQASVLSRIGAAVQIAGWGQIGASNPTFNSEDNAVYPSRLQVGQSKIVACGLGSYSYNGRTWPLSPNMMCASGSNLSKPADTCIGDSGSGLIVGMNQGQPYLAGITSWGEDKPCGTRALPSVYTRVSNYDDWILSYVDPAAYAARLEQQKAERAASASSGGGGSSSPFMVLGLLGLVMLRRRWLG